MENLIFSLNATIPIFLMMLLGMLFRKLGWMDEVFAAKMNKFVFLVPLPVLLFEQLATVDFSEVWDIKFILFCFVVTAISITISTLISMLWKDRSIKGEFIQATYRSSAALLGIAFIQNIYGTAGMAPLMIIARCKCSDIKKSEFQHFLLIIINMYNFFFLYCSDLPCV